MALGVGFYFYPRGGSRAKKVDIKLAAALIFEAKRVKKGNP